MKVRMLASAAGSAPLPQYLTTFLVGDRVSVDAGALGLQPPGEVGSGVRHVFITHAHLDHIGTLPLFLENRDGAADGPLNVYGHPAALAAMREHIFNGRVWVDYGRLANGNRACLEMHALENEQMTEVEGLRVTAVPVQHVVPTYAYLVDDGESAVIFGADSGPTDRLWEVARACSRLRAVFLECSFPDELAALALQTGHLTPRMWRRELERIPSAATVIAVHLKPLYREQLISELRGLGCDRVVVGDTGHEYSW